MERKYLLRKNYKARLSGPGIEILGHLAFKTKNALWVETPFPVVVLISVQSLFHRGEEGAMKMEAFLSIIRTSVQSPVTALIADTAHLEARRLTEGDRALSRCHQEAETLLLKYKHFFAAFELLSWHSLERKEEFLLLSAKIRALSVSDPEFRRLLEQDAEALWTQKWQEHYTDQKSFIEKTIDDMINQCACLQLLAKMGYRYIFYPGAPYHAYLYLDSMEADRIEWIDVFLTIEKKVIRSRTL